MRDGGGSETPTGAASSAGLGTELTRADMEALGFYVPCDEPAASVVLVLTQSGRVVARTTTGRTGGYRLTLRPGRYGVRTTTRTLGSGLSPRTVLVLRYRVARVDFEIDTGIR